MFADVCLSCSKPVFGSRAYCCDECAFNDQPSPSLSSTSSVYQSPSLNAALKGVPGLVNASGSGRHSRNRSSLSSSSTSSYLSTPSAPALTDDDESLSDLDRDVLDLRFNAPQHQSQQTDHADPKQDQGADAESFDIKTRRTAISYARRPSATNTRSTIPVPMLKQHTGSDSRSYSERQAHSRLAPLSPSALDDDHEFDIDNDGLAALSISLSSTLSLRRRRHRRNDVDDKTLPAQKPKRARGSLPAYFSLLQSGLEARSPPPTDGSRATPASPSSTLRQSLEDKSRSAHSPDTPTAGASSPLVYMSIKAEDPVLIATESSLKDGRLRARINSIEKVQDWFQSATSPLSTPPPATRPIDVDINLQSGVARGRPTMRRRLSSSERLVSTEPPFGVGFEGLDGDGERGRGREVERVWEKERGRTESRGRSGRRAVWQPEEFAETSRGRRRSVAMRVAS